VSTIPAFQAQNPAISGYSLGWSSCTAFAAAMAASYDRKVQKLCTGAQVRRLTGDTTGGLTLAQVDAALLEGWNVNLNTTYRLSWDKFAANIDAGRGAILQLWYAPIADSRFDAGNGFRKNHAVFVPPGWGAMDPLADGRNVGVYKYRNEPYPRSMLREAAGLLNLSTSGFSPLGTGLVYASFTRDNEPAYTAIVRPVPPATRKTYFRYVVTDGVIKERVEARTGGFQASCIAPRLYRWPAKSRSVSLVRLTSGAHSGDFISSTYATEV
jgi:hypothetical protein